MRRSRRISRKSNRKSRRNNTLRKTRRKNTRRVSRRRNTRKNTGRVSRRNTRGVSRRRNIRRRTKRRNTRKVSRKRVIGGGDVTDDIRTLLTCSRKDAEKIKEYFIEAFYSEKIIGEKIINELTEMRDDVRERWDMKAFLEAIDNHSKKGKVIVVKSCVDKLDSEGKIEITDTDDETYKITRDKLVEIDEIDELPLKDEVYYLSGDNTEEVENIRDAKDDVVYVTLDNISAYKGTELKFKDPEDTSKSGEYIFPDKTSAGAVLIFIKNKQGTYHFLHQIDEYAWKEFKNSGNYWTVLKGFT